MQTQKVIVSILFLCVPLLLLFTFTYLPFFKMVQFSFYDMKYIGKRTWVGLQNYISVFTREDCLNALKLSLFYLVGSFVQIAIALLFASILSFPTKGGKFFRGALYFPSLIGGIAVGFIFKFFFTHGFVLDTLLTWVGMDADSLPFWLKDKSINNWVLAATSIWRYMGQNMVLFIGAIASVDTTQYEAAAIDGAGKWQQITRITIPMLKPTIIMMTLLSIGRIFYSDFGLFYQVPQNSGALYPVTNTIDTYVYRGLLELGNISLSAAAGLYQSVIGFILVLGTNLWVRKIDPDNALF